MTGQRYGFFGKVVRIAAVAQPGKAYSSSSKKPRFVEEPGKMSISSTDKAHFEDDFHQSPHKTTA
jgi:hypothetical protein